MTTGEVTERFDTELQEERVHSGILNEVIDLCEDDDLQLLEACNLSEDRLDRGQLQAADLPSKRARLCESRSNDEEQNCTICFEQWSNTGKHQLCSLKCGHLFGLSCIQRWLTGSNKRCPQCNARAKRSHIRLLFATSLVAVDSSEKDRAMKELHIEREARLKAEERQAKVMLDCEMAKVEVERLKRSLVEFERLSQQNTVQSQLLRCHDFPLRSQSCTSSYQVYSSCVISEDGGIRLLDFSPDQRILACSKQHSSGCGILKVSTSDTSHREYVAVHSKLLKDLHFSPAGDSMLLSCSLDKTIKLTSLQNNAIVQNYSTPCPAWSCCWSRSDCNSIFCGLCNGKVLVFDLRKTSGPVTELAAVGKSCPVISIASLPDRGILIATFGELALWYKQNSVWQLQPLLKPEAPVTSLDFDPGSLYTMLSLRLPKDNNRCQHLVGQLQTHDAASSGILNIDYSYIPGVRLDGGMHCALMTRSRICSVPRSEGCELLAVAADEMTRTVCVWDMHSGALKQRLPPCSSPVLDIQPFTVDGCHYLATSTEHQLIVYNWK